MQNTRKLVFISMLVSLALILSYIESFLPAIPIPGAKIGLANIATLLSLSTMSFEIGFFVVIARTILSSLMFGNMSVLLYSLGGGLLSLLVMGLFIRLFKNKISTIGVSIIGAVFHNIGQLIIASLILENINIIYLLPYLLLIALPTGLFVGLVSQYLLKYLKNNYYYFK